MSNKILKFFELLDEGLNRKEAAAKAGISDATSKVQFSKWKKQADKPKDEDDEDDVTIEKE